MQDVLDEDDNVIDQELVAVEDADKRSEIEGQELSQAWDSLRAERDKLLAETDHMMLPDYPITQESKDEMETYRQALRDFPSSITDPREEYTMPEKPE